MRPQYADASAPERQTDDRRYVRDFGGRRCSGSRQGAIALRDFGCELDASENPLRFG